MTMMMMGKKRKVMSISGDMSNKEKTTTEAAAHSSVPLPEDVLIDIVARLPVKSILRFKSVSKEWGALVTAPHFITTHLRHATFSNKVVVSGGTLGGGRRRHSGYNSGSANYEDDVVHLSFKQLGEDEYHHIPQDYSSY